MSRFLLRAVRTLLLLLLLPTAAMAAQLTFDQAMRSITSLEWLLIFVLSTLTGGLTLTMRFSAYVNSFPVDKQVPPMRAPWMLSCAHMLGSWLAGLLGFFMASRGGLGGLDIALLVLLSAFGGAKTLEWAYGRTFGKQGDT